MLDENTRSYNTNTIADSQYRNVFETAFDSRYGCHQKRMDMLPLSTEEDRSISE